MNTINYQITSEFWNSKVGINVVIYNKKLQWDFHIWNKTLFFKEKQSNVGELKIGNDVPLDFLYSDFSVKELFSDLKYNGLYSDTYHIYEKKALKEFQIYLSKFNKLKPNIKKDIILKFGV